jgi:hypothetical protein
MKTLLQNHRNNIALVIGNGINQYGPAKKANSWNDLLVKLAGRYFPSGFHGVPGGIELTEFYDVLELKSDKSISEKSLQKEFCDLLSSWKCFGHHKRIVKWAKEANAPILTTNFEQALSDAGGCIMYRVKKGGFTDFYPWETYYGTRVISDPSKEFGIWHVNGMQFYHRSVRLGLTHYMGSVERARGWLHKGNERNLFSGKDVHRWAGAASWLHIVFNTPLLIFGLSLGENEVFLRWLLIERARYFKKFPDRKKEAWYVHHSILKDGKRFFLEGVGVQPVGVASYDEIYGAATWS